MNLRNIPRVIRCILLSCAALIFATAPVYSLPLETEEPEISQTPIQLPELTELQRPQFTPGIPDSTTPSDVRQGAALTWTPTGIGEQQDTYEIIVSQSNEITTGVLTGERVFEETGLVSPQVTIESLGEGTFYWQVRSCMIAEACNGWSSVTAVTIDGTAPAPAVATVTSGLYDKSVTVGGTAEQGATVTINVSDVLCQTTTQSDGSWTCAFSEDFDYGVYDASVTVTDKAGNQSSEGLIIRVKELFVATQITTQELPPALEIIPIDESPENKVFQQPISVVDSVNTLNGGNDERVLSAAVSTLSTDGGVVQASESGWQVVGVPWFVWAGSVTSVIAGWWVFGGPSPRRLGSMLSL